MLPFPLIAMAVAGISAYRYAKDARPQVFAKVVIVSLVATSILAYWLTVGWTLALMVVQLSATLLVTVHFQLLDADESDGTR